MSETIEAPENLVGLINQLVEVRPPEPVSMMPQTSGWAVLGVLVSVALLWGGRRALGRYRANAYRRAALNELARVGEAPAEVSLILKRAALVAYPRVSVASLSGEAWLRFLDDTGGVGGFETGAGAVIGTAAYAPPSATATVGLNALACQWVRQHSVEAVS